MKIDVKITGTRVVTAQLSPKELGDALRDWLFDRKGVEIRPEALFEVRTLQPPSCVITWKESL